MSDIEQFNIIRNSFVKEGWIIMGESPRLFTAFPPKGVDLSHTEFVVKYLFRVKYIEKDFQNLKNDIGLSPIIKKVVDLINTQK